MKIKSTILLCLLSLIFLSFFSYKTCCINLNKAYHINNTTRNLNCIIKKFSANDNRIKKQTKKPAMLSSTACCIIEKDSGQILYEKNSARKLPMASTTKIMTCIIALENGKSDDIVKVSDYAASMPKVKLYMNSGDTFRLRDLLYSLMLESHNDTAVAIAEHIGGSVKGFASLMNRKASELGCRSTHFVTPNGLDSNKHYTTAYELCRIAAYAIKNKNFQKIITTPSYSFSNTDGSKHYNVVNKDAFLSQYSGAIGIKTGFTNKAGYCFCGAVKRKNTTLISSVLGCGWPPNKTYKWADTKKLMDYGFNSFSKVTFKPQKRHFQIKILNGQTCFTDITVTDNPCALMLSQSDNVTYKIKLPSTLTAPVTKNDILGYSKIYINNKLYRQTPLKANCDIRAITPGYIRQILLKTLCNIFI